MAPASTRAAPAAPMPTPATTTPTPRRTTPPATTSCAAAPMPTPATTTPTPRSTTISLPRGGSGLQRQRLPMPMETESATGRPRSNEPDMDVVVLLHPEHPYRRRDWTACPSWAPPSSPRRRSRVGTGPSSTSCLPRQHEPLPRGQPDVLDLFDAADVLCTISTSTRSIEEGGDLGTFDDPAGFYLSGEAIEGCRTRPPVTTTRTPPFQHPAPEQHCGTDYYNCDGNAQRRRWRWHLRRRKCPDAATSSPATSMDATDVDDSLCTYLAEDYLDCDGNKPVRCGRRRPATGGSAPVPTRTPATTTQGHRRRRVLHLR